MAEWRDEIEAAVNSVVHNVSTVETALVMEVALKLVINIADNGAKTGWRKICWNIQYTTSKHPLKIEDGSNKIKKITHLPTLYSVIPVLAVDGISVSWCVHHSETKFHTSFLNFYCRRLDLNSPFYLLYRRTKNKMWGMWGCVSHYKKNNSNVDSSVFYLLLLGWPSLGKGQWGRGCWSRWTSQVQTHLKKKKRKVIQ